MYSDVFCKVYNEFGWNYYPEAFGEQLLEWLKQNQVSVKTSMDLACGTGSVTRLLTEDSHSTAAQIAAVAVHRAAKIAAVLCAGPILRAARDASPVRVAVEGSQYWRLTGFREAFHRELEALIPDRTVKIVKTEESCLRGAALAAFAEPMEEA